MAHAHDDEARQRAVLRLNAGIERATHLVDQLLLLARQQDGAGPALRPLVLMDVLRLALADPEAHARNAAEPASASGADTAANTFTTDTTITGDADALQVLLRNLLDNVVKCTPAGGRVDVALQREPRALCLRVDDSGPGIAPAERERVFDRFYRTPDAAATAEAPGNGLGLAIVKAIADSHGATLTLGRSQRLGGLCVELRLPLAA